MSFTPGFAPDARSQWLSLDPVHQELALDELDRLCASPPVEIDHVATAVYEEKGMLHHVFLHVLLNHERRTITVVGVGHAAIPMRS